ncbi:hypothetical protein VT84_16370 [Gemmata sp. SH-PL17]|nr:hypothetical protein VT84_16370 [Gemmata sp. SH-PL17]
MGGCVSFTNDTSYNARQDLQTGRRFRTVARIPDGGNRTANFLWLMARQELRRIARLTARANAAIGTVAAFRYIVRDEQPPSESRIGAGSLNGEPSPKVRLPQNGDPAPRNTEANTTFPQGHGRGRDFPPLLNLSDNTSVPPSTATSPLPPPPQAAARLFDTRDDFKSWGAYTSRLTPAVRQRIPLFQIHAPPRERGERGAERTQCRARRQHGRHIGGGSRE